VGRALASLQAAGFLYEASLFPDVLYRFNSVLTRDVAYASLLREQRRVLHARIVDAIARLYHDRRTSHVDQLAARGAPPDTVQARARYEDALRLAGELGLRPLVVACRLSLGALEARLGANESAARRRAQAQQMLDELDMRSGREQAEREVTELGHLFIVARSQPDLYDFLAQELSGAERIRVLFDRRRGEQRQRFDALTEERRRAERRREQLDQDLRDWGFGVAPRRHG
jgi:hypothetical protein